MQRARRIGNKFSLITTATTTQVTTKDAILHRILVGVATTTVDVYDDADSDNNQVIDGGALPIGSYEVGLEFNGGIRVVTTGTGTVTVIYELISE